MRYEETVEISKEQHERWNALLSTDFDEMTEEFKEKYEPKKFDSEGGFEIHFDNGFWLTIDLASGSENYYDDCTLHDANGTTDHVFDCSYEIDSEENVFVYDNDEYVVKWKIV